MTTEQHILISMVYYPYDIDAFMDKVNVHIFSKEAKEIFKHILHLKDSGVLNIDILYSSLPDGLKNSVYCKELLLCTPNSNYLNMVDIFKDEYLLNKQKETAKNMLEANKSGVVLSLDDYQNSKDLLPTAFLTLKEWREYYKNLPIKKIYPTNIPFIDNCFKGGFTLGQLMLILGDPEAGKTMLSLQILENLSLHCKTCFFCFEFTIDDYLYRRANSHFVNAENMIIINDDYELSEVAENIKKLAKKHIRFFLIDSQLRLTNSLNNTNPELSESEKFSVLAKLCHSLNVFIIFICQSSKTDRVNPIGSKRGAHEASIIIRLVKKDNSDEREIIILKNKQTGNHYKDTLTFNKSELRFYEKEDESEKKTSYSINDIKINYIDEKSKDTKAKKPDDKDKKNKKD